MTEKLVHELKWDEVAPLLLKAKGIKSGLWRLAVKMHFGAVSGNWPQGGGGGDGLPTGAIAIAGLALFSTDAPGPLTYDAATGRPTPAKLQGQKRPAAKKTAQK